MDFLRKAKALLIEETPDENTTKTAVPTNDDPLARIERQSLDVDKLLQEQGLGLHKNTSNAANAPADNAPTKTQTVEQMVQNAPGPDLKDVNVEAKVGSAPMPPTAIYEAAKLPPSPFSAEQMLEMLAGLPAELPLEIKRQTVKVTLGALGKTMGATPETIVADASRKMAALKSYSDHLQKRTDEFAKNGESEIAGLQKQIEDKRKAIEEARASLNAATQSCVKEAQRLDDVLEFFSLDVAPSKYAPQKEG